MCSQTTAPFAGIWLHPHEDESEFGIVHIIGVGAGRSEGLQDHTRQGFHQSRSSTGSPEHIAFLAKDWPQMRARCQAHQVAYLERPAPDRSRHQVFLLDPSGITLELTMQPRKDTYDRRCQLGIVGASGDVFFKMLAVMT